MPSASDEPTQDAAGIIGAGLPPGRLEELRPRLEALLADFAHLVELETAELEPLPAFDVTHGFGERHA
jgi:hypothetical protein